MLQYALAWCKVIPDISEACGNTHQHDCRMHMVLIHTLQYSSKEWCSLIRNKYLNIAFLCSKFSRILVIAFRQSVDRWAKLHVWWQWHWICIAGLRISHTLASQHNTRNGQQMCLQYMGITHLLSLFHIKWNLLGEIYTKRITQHNVQFNYICDLNLPKTDTWNQFWRFSFTNIWMH